MSSPGFPRAAAPPPRSVTAAERAATLVVDAVGVVRDCSRAAETLFGYVRDELVGRHVSLLLPGLAGAQLVKDDRVNPRLAFLCRCGIAHQALRRDGSAFAGALVIALRGSPGARSLSLYVRNAAAQA